MKHEYIIFSQQKPSELNSNITTQVRMLTITPFATDNLLEPEGHKLPTLLPVKLTDFP